MLHCQQQSQVVASSVIDGKRDSHAHGSKPTRAILLCPAEKRFTAPSSAWRFYQAALNFSEISICKLKNKNKKFQPDSNILAFKSRLG